MLEVGGARLEAIRRQVEVEVERGCWRSKVGGRRQCERKMEVGGSAERKLEVRGWRLEA